MRTHFVSAAAAAALLISSATTFAQQPSSPPSNNPGAPVPGANSFTEAQAKARLEKAGYSNVSALKKDDKGIWRGTGMKDGKSVIVSVDYQGNMTP